MNIKKLLLIVVLAVSSAACFVEVRNTNEIWACTDDKLFQGQQGPACAYAGECHGEICNWIRNNPRVVK